VYEVALDPAQLSSRKGPDVRSAFRLEASVLDVSSGELLLVKTWATRAHESSILATYAGVAVRTGSLLRFYSRDFEEIKQLQLLHPDPYEEWEIRTSPTGKTIFLNHYIRNRARGLSRFQVLDGGTFETRRDWTESPALWGKLYSISDGSIAVRDLQHRHGAIQ